jgi:uridine monophosphate synthetase
MNVFDKIQQRQQTLDSALCLGLDPRPAWFTAADRSGGNPWLAWGQRLIAAAGDAVCCVKPNIAFYEAGGLPALDGLRATIAFAHERDLPVLLDAKRGDIGSTAEAYAQAAYEWLDADAVTVNPYLGFDGVSPFLQDPARGVFVLCHTSNPGAAEFQMQLVEGRPLHIVVAEQVARWSDRAGLVVGATYPEAIAAVRRVAPAAWLLLPGVGAQGGDLAAAVAAARTRFIVPTSRALAVADDPAAAARALRDAIRSAQAQASPAKMPPSGEDNEDLILDLHRIGAVQFGEFTLASGLSSPIYIDLRLLPSDPPALSRAAATYAGLLRGLQFDRLAAIPYAALPIGTAVALQTGRPLIYPRKEVKTHGRGRAIEGHFAPGERAVVLDDLITTGGSKLEAIQVLRDAGLVVEDVVVLIDRQASGAADLAAHGVRLHAVLTLAEIIAALAARGAISAAQKEAVERYLAGGG